MTRVVTFGETMALFAAAAVGPLTQVDRFRLGIGGAESNVAIGLTRLGVDATWIGRVGDDELGELVRRELRAEGVDVRAIVDAEAPTGVMIKNRRTPQHGRVLYYRSGSAGSRLGAADIEADLIAAADVLHVTGITPALSDSAAGAIESAIEVARDAGVAVSFDVNHRSALWGIEQAGATYRRLAARATIVFAGLDEAALIADGETADQLASGIRALGPREVIIKRGSQGCHALIDDESFDLPAIAVEAVDTVGAGDAFAAGYLAERCRGADAETRLLTARRAGAFACLGVGDWESLPTRSDLELIGRADETSR